jgi:hypothetical protein
MAEPLKELALIIIALMLVMKKIKKRKEGL